LITAILLYPAHFILPTLFCLWNRFQSFFRFLLAARTPPFSGFTVPDIPANADRFPDASRHARARSSAVLPYLGYCLIADPARFPVVWIPDHFASGHFAAGDSTSPSPDCC